MAEAKTELTIEELDKNIEALREQAKGFQEKFHQAVGAVNLLEHLRAQFVFKKQEEKKEG